MTGSGAPVRVSLHFLEDDETYGKGHRYRVEALAAALRALGVEVLFNPGPTVEVDGVVLDFPSRLTVDWDSLPSHGKTVWIIGIGYEVTDDVLRSHDLVVYQGPRCLVPQPFQQRYGGKIVAGFQNIILRPEFWGKTSIGQRRSGSVALYLGSGVLEDTQDVVRDYIVREGLTPLEVGGTAADVVTTLDLSEYFLGTTGVVAYEALARGLKPRLLSVDQDHRAHARILADLGLAYDLGYVDYMNVWRKLPGFFLYPEPVPGVVDGIGANRVARRILSVI